MTAETVEKAPRVVPNPAERDAALRLANTKARKQFTEKFEGAFIPLKIVLFNRPVVREFNRTFHISMRNWYTATTVPRSALGDSTLANQVEAGMLKKVTETVKWFKNKIEQCEVIAKDDKVDFDLIGHGASYEETVPVIGPVAMQMHGMFKLADRYLDLMSALYSFGQIDGEASSNATYEVKKRLNAVATSIRNFRRMALQKVNEQGRSRDGFKAVDVNEGDLPVAPEDEVTADDAAEEVKELKAA